MLQVLDCYKSYNERDILKGVTFSVSSNEKVALVGKNGAGKTTLLNIISGVSSPTKGSVLFNNKNLFEFPQLRRHIGFASTEPILYEKLTSFENLELIGSLYGVRQQSSIFRAAKEMDLTSYLDKQVAILSTGMKKKLHLATALIHQPDLLLLDEPFNGLDTESVDRFVTVLNNFNGAILFTSHRADLVLNVADRIICLDDGVIVDDYKTREGEHQKKEG